MIYRLINEENFIFLVNESNIVICKKQKMKKMSAFYKPKAKRVK